MKLKVFCVYDSKVNSFAKPFYQLTTGEALRSWTDLANDGDGNNLIAKHPGDFALMEIASYDESTGTFENLPAPLNLGLATQYKKQAEQAPLFNMNKGTN